MPLRPKIRCLRIDGLEVNLGGTKTVSVKAARITKSYSKVVLFWHSDEDNSIGNIRETKL